MRAFGFLLVTVFCIQIVHAQSGARRGGFTREVEVGTDNDFIFFEDFYYTAGFDLSYRRLINPESWLHKLVNGTEKDSAKTIFQFQTGIKIFNPRNLRATSPMDMDRPYAGWNFARASATQFPGANTGNRYEVELGTVGKMSGMAQLQHWLHKQEGYLPPKGWDYQINNELVVNFYYSRFNNWKMFEAVDLINQVSVQAGTGGNKLSEDVTFRLFSFNPINNSAFTQSRLNWNQPSGQKEKEVFVFVGIGGDYVVSNIFVEGSLFKSNRSLYRVSAEPWIFRGNAGIMYSSKRISTSLILYHLSREVAQGTEHSYASIRLACRF